MKYLLLAVVLGSMLRLVYITQLPSGFTPDEAAFGYNAYSLGQTGRDEWSTPFWQLPLTNLRSFGDYKLPLYAFLAVPTIKIFGLNEFATRLPNSIIGIFSIITTAICASKLFPTNKRIMPIASFAVALSPWSVQLSRGAFEANLVTCFFPLAISLWLSKKSLLAVLMFGINFYSYHSARLLTPIYFASIFLYKKPANWIRSIILLVCLVFPGIIAQFFSANTRIADVSIISPTDKWQAVSDRRYDSVAFGEPDKLARFFSNKFTYVVSLVKHNVIQYISPEFLFTNGPAESTYGMIRGRGVLYGIEGIGLISFFVMLCIKPNKTQSFILGMLLICAVPAALAKGPGYAANRSVSMLPFFLIASSYGFSILIKNIQKYKKIVILTVFITYTIESLFFVEDYVIHSPRQTASSMNYGWKEAFARTVPAIARLSHIYIDTALSEPHIFAAFYLKIPPQTYHRYSKSWTDFNQKGIRFLDQLDGYQLENMTFGHADKAINDSKYQLIMAKTSEISNQANELFRINYPNGHPAISVISNE